MVKFSCNSCECCMMLYSFGQVSATRLRRGMRTSSICNPQRIAVVATRRNTVAKRAQDAAQNNFAMCYVLIAAVKKNDLVKRCLDKTIKLLTAK